MDAVELDENWRRACRADPELNRFDDPPPSPDLVAGVLSRVRGNPTPPDAALRGLAVGLAMVLWDAGPEVAYLQLAKLVTEAARDSAADSRSALAVLETIGHAAVSNLLVLWRNEAEEDMLTRLGNRRRMEKKTQQLAADDFRFAYASIDVDGLKAVNDSRGHDAGDELIQFVASHLSRELGPAAAVYRRGGDEFSVILQLGTADDEGSLHQLLQGAHSTLRDGVAFSFGVSVWPDEDPDVHTILALADRKMYTMKESRKAGIDLTASQAEMS